MMCEDDNEILRRDTPPDSDTLDNSPCTGTSEIIHVQHISMSSAVFNVLFNIFNCLYNFTCPCTIAVVKCISCCYQNV